MRNTTGTIQDQEATITQVFEKNNTVLERVEYILATYPYTRDSKQALLQKYYVIFHTVWIPIEFLYSKGIPTFSTVGRMMRKVQNSWGKYKPTISEQMKRTEEEVANQRYHR